MKRIITLEFEEDERDRLETFLEAEDWRSLVSTFDYSILRPIVKHGCESEERCKVYTEIREKLYELLGEHGLRL